MKSEKVVNVNLGSRLCAGKEMEEIKKTMTAAPCQNNTVWLGRKL